MIVVISFVLVLALLLVLVLVHALVLVFVLTGASASSKYFTAVICCVAGASAGSCCLAR